MPWGQAIELVKDSKFYMCIRVATPSSLTRTRTRLRQVYQWGGSAHLDWLEILCTQVVKSYLHWQVSSKENESGFFYYGDETDSTLCLDENFEKRLAIIL